MHLLYAFRVMMDKLQLKRGDLIETSLLLIEFLLRCHSSYSQLAVQFCIKQHHHNMFNFLSQHTILIIVPANSKKCLAFLYDLMRNGNDLITSEKMGH